MAQGAGLDTPATRSGRPRGNNRGIRKQRLSLSRDATLGVLSALERQTYSRRTFEAPASENCARTLSGAYSTTRAPT